MTGCLRRRLSFTLDRRQGCVPACLIYTVEDGLEALADHLETHADIAALAHIAGVKPG